jgi:AraC family transcriptional regulator
MNSNQLEAIGYTIETIEKNLEKPFQLDDLSKEVGISKYHLIRLFYGICGKSVMNYARARRLSLSLSDLINSKNNILDIALKYQFEYEQSYIRAFQKQFHITPAKYRRYQTEMPIEQKIDIKLLKTIGQGFVIQPKMIIKPSFHVEGIKDEIIHEQNLTEYTTNQLAMLFINNYKPMIQNKINEHVYLALILYGKNPYVSNMYLPCVETTILNESEKPLASYTIPTQEYAVFRYVGFHSLMNVTYKTLKELYDYITWQWKLNTSYKQAQPYHFERMDFSICSDTYCEMDLYYPILTV